MKIFSCIRRGIHQLGWRKPVGDLSVTADSNKIPNMGTIDMVAFGIGSCVGAGVFVTTGQIASQNSGAAAWLSFLLAGGAALLSGLCYSEFAARLPLDGGIYAYSYATFGELMGYIIGWNMTLQYAISAGGVAISWANYVLAFVASFGAKIPVGASPYPLSAAFHIFPLPLAIIIILLIILLFGAGDSSRFNVIMTCWNITLICFVIIYGGTFFDKDNLKPFMPFGFGGVLAGAGVAFFSFIGFDAVSTMSAEAKNPRRDVPIGLIGSLFVACILYCLLSFVITAIVPLDILATKSYQDAPVAQAFLHVDRPWATKLVAFGSITTLTSTTLCSLMGQSQIFLPMAQDGLLPPIFAKLDHRGVPVFSLCLTAVIACILAMFLQFDTIVNAVSLGSFINYSTCCAGTLILRMTTIGSESSGPLVYKTARWRRASVDSRITIGLLTAYMFGTWIFWMVYLKYHLSLAGAVVLGVFIMGLPFIGIVYIYFFTEVIADPKTFQCPLMPFVPLGGIFVNSVLMSSLPSNAYIYVIIWVLVGVLFYGGYGLRYSNYVELHPKDGSQPRTVKIGLAASVDAQETAADIERAHAEKEPNLSLSASKFAAVSVSNEREES